VQESPRPAPGPGRRARGALTRESIVATALRMMDTSGPEAVSIRSLAEELGVGAMTLYTYFRSKDELYDAVRDHALSLSPPPPADGPWEERVRAVMGGLHALLLDHPSLVRLLVARPLAGPEIARLTEAQLAALRDAGFDRATAASVHVTLVYHLLGSAIWETQRHSERSTATVAGSVVVEALPAGEYPTVVDLADALARTSGGPAQFAFGLDLVLAALRARLTRP
jgi:AcrR family transcriptional regulator